MCKVLERIVTWRLQNYLEKNTLLDRNQSGFRAGHSTMDAVCHLEDTIRSNLIKGNSVVAVFLDISQAFDSVWHHGLLVKLRDLGLSGNLPKFIRDFLSDRHASVRVDSTTSSPHPIKVGVPQGSVISPCLFTIMINDLFHNCAMGVKYSIYADDCAFWIGGYKIPECIQALQQTLDSIDTWSQEWGLQLSLPKTKAMIFTRRRKLPDTPLLLNQSAIEYVTSYKFLGVIFDRGLTWKTHILSLREKCRKDLRLLSIISSQGWGAAQATLRKLYLAMTGSKLDYASCVFATASPSLLIHLDRIQFAAARIILGTLRCTRVDCLETEADLMPLSLRRRLQMTSYASRILTVEDHPLRDLITDYYPYAFYQQQKQPLPVTARIYEEFVLLDVRYDEVPLVEISLRYSTTTLPVHTSLHIIKKDSLSPRQWRKLFLVMLSTYEGYTTVYTDGSLQGTEAGAGVWSENFSLMARLPPNTSIFTAELYALYSAIEYAQASPGKFLFLTDSYSSISALRQPHYSKHYLVHKISKGLQSLVDRGVAVEWVPGHMRITGNDQADKLAKQSLNLHTVTRIAMPNYEIAAKLKTFYHAAWQTQWTPAPTHSCSL